MGALAGVVCVLLVALPIGLLIGALILRAAIWLANKCLPQPSSRYDDDYDDWDDDRPRSRRGSGTAIPEPALGKAMGVVFVIWIVSGVVGFMMGAGAGGAGMANNQAAMLALQGCSTIISFVITAAILTAMLPTSFPRACLVVLFQFLIGLAIALIIILPLVLILGVGLGGLR